MVGCSAPNCTASSRKGDRFFSFPSNKERCSRWLINCRRDCWTPTKHSKLCEHHFESNQFEQNRKDGLKKLKPLAVPTLFDVPNPPKKIESKRRVLKRKQEDRRVSSNVSKNDDHCSFDHSYAKRIMLEKSIEENNIDEPFLDDNNSNVTIVTSSANEFSCENCHALELENRRLKRKIKFLEASILNEKKTLSCFLANDQIEALKLKSNLSNKWSDETIKTALQIRCACGIRGYEFLRKLCFPLPAYSTLCSRVSNVELRPGLQFIIMDWMETKMKNMVGHEKLCTLAIDEVQISSAIQYDPGLKQFLGYIDEGFKRKVSADAACHALCFMAKGITLHWKQVVAYFFTGYSVSGEDLWRSTKMVVKQLSERGFLVKCIVSDMGACNQAMWKKAGIVSNRAELVQTIVHPVNPEEKLNFLADVPHLLKNLRSALLRNVVHLPSFVVDKYSLPTEKVSVHWIKELVKYQEGKELKLAPKLTAAHMNPSQYQKMNVKLASQVLSYSTAAALRTLIRQCILPKEALTTAFFCEYFNKWFDIMNCRFMGNALYTNSREKIFFLNEVLAVAMEIKIGSSWKPVQSGIRLSTSSMLQLHQQLVIDGELKFLLSGRFTQDALENLFSQIRSKGVTHPKPVQFRLSLRLICLAQFMTIPTTGNYEIDDTPHLISFIRSREKSSKTKDQDCCEKDEDSNDEVALRLLSSAAATDDVCESNGFYYAVGWAVHKELKKAECPHCASFFSSTTVDSGLEQFSLLTAFKSYHSEVGGAITSNYLCHPSKNAFALLQRCEIIFRSSVSEFFRFSNPETKLFSMVCFNANEFPDCHHLENAILRRYIKLRLNIYANELSRKICNSKQYAGKMAARSFIT